MCVKIYILFNLHFYSSSGLNHGKVWPWPFVYEEMLISKTTDQLKKKNIGAATNGFPMAPSTQKRSPDDMNCSQFTAVLFS